MNTNMLVAQNIVCLVYQGLDTHAANSTYAHILMVSFVIIIVVVATLF